MSISNLLATIDNIPPNHRVWEGEIMAWHITTVDRGASIKQTGLLARACRASTFGPSRPEAVYLFVDRPDWRNGPILLGDVDNYALVTITLPASDIGKLSYDGPYAMTQYGYGAVAYHGDILPSNIMGIEIISVSDTCERLPASPTGKQHGSDPR